MNLSSYLTSFITVRGRNFAGYMKNWRMRGLKGLFSMAQEIYLKLHIFQHKAHPLILIGMVDSYRKGRKFFNIKISDP